MNDVLLNDVGVLVIAFLVLWGLVWSIGRNKADEREAFEFLTPIDRKRFLPWFGNRLDHVGPWLGPVLVVAFIIYAAYHVIRDL